MNDLTLLTAFVRVAECGSFSAAARERGVTQPTMSRAVGRLERSLGVQLLARTTRSVTLTPAGERYLEEARLVLTAMERANEVVQQAHAAPVGTLRVTAPIGYGQNRIAPVLMDWLGKWSDARVELALTDRIVDLVSEGFDVAIRIGQLDASTLRAVKVGREPRCTVAAPELTSPLAHPRALHTLPMIGFGSMRRPFAGTWTRGDESEAVVLKGRFTVDHLPTLRDALLRGLGASVVPSWLVADDLAAGRLIDLLPGWSAGAWPVHALVAPGRHTPRRIKLFIEGLKSSLA